ncbi:phosphoribosylanthranilate isomerase [Erythrobacteraceae bacterium CFH 75059]|uniref:phosphoribosylanthranilate isomerase n=1 Tax=Qipengyuania thermophila TaxID=2509361 RepID=UPI00101EE1A4|nr:phosphoribosylanthranilate isomerase [Qipengyuania thermophila]TCD05401.1 phosphoribosylanthranilate isomerase [Erythrobacteraceae bacterium CFH 75059]
MSESAARGRVQVKICGLTTAETVDAAVDAGATHIGFVHHPPSPRHLEPGDAARLRARIPPTARVVLLTSEAEPLVLGRAIEAIRPDVLQFHGRESPQWVGLVRENTRLEVWKAVGMRDAGTLERAAKWTGIVDRLIFDAPAAALPGGNGETFDWSLLKDHRHQVPWGLAGGLTPDNVTQAIRATGAELVDVSSGVEREPGVKDSDLVRAFCAAALSA